jgi:ABC-2 type transport system ATP-binding protein
MAQVVPDEKVGVNAPGDQAIDLSTHPRTSPGVRREGVSMEPALVLHEATKVFNNKAKKGQASLWQRLTFRNGSDGGGVKAVDNVTLSVSRGEVFGILGSNGSGKSTLIRLISTLLLPDAGEIRVFGHDVVRDEMAVKRLINRVSVDAAFFKKLSPWENLVYAARLYGMDATVARSRSIEILNQLGLRTSRIDEPLEHMSRGMQQKVAIARAFLTSPVLMLLDEPTTGLDPRSKLDVQKFIRDVRQRHDATILLTTHDMTEADRLCDRLAIINDGRVVALGTPASLKEQCATDGKPGSLEDVFMQFTGRSLEDEDADAEGSDE